MVNIRRKNIKLVLIQMKANIITQIINIFMSAKKEKKDKDSRS